MAISKLLAQTDARDVEKQGLAAQMSRIRDEPCPSGHGRVYIDLKRVVEGEAKALEARLKELQARVGRRCQARSSRRYGQEARPGDAGKRLGVRFNRGGVTRKKVPLESCIQGERMRHD